MAVPEGASCYFCLDEGPDEEGEPLVRDCSCRGDSAGFAHLSCIVHYAEHKSTLEANSPAFTTSWEDCPNCKQPYQNKLSLDLASAFVSFAEVTYGCPENSKWDKINVMHSLRSKIIILNNIMHSKSLYSSQDSGMLKVECETLIKKLLSMVERMKKDEKMDGWVHMPRTSFEYNFCEMIGVFEAFGYGCFGASMSLDKTEESNNTSIKYFEKARIIYNLFGKKKKSKEMESHIEIFRARSAKSNEDDTNVRATDIFEKLRINYETKLELHGLTSVVTMAAGLDYAKVLLNYNHGIEAERIVMKLVTESCRVHGPEHNCTKSAEELLEVCKERYVMVLPYRGNLFQALRYENDGEICVLTGPLAEPRKADDERMLQVASDLIRPTFGCPVICHGLVSASHLNGKVGHVRAFHKNSRLAVHFEDKSQKPASVKADNLRIAFELPTKG
ncbi:hypothetical protein ACHAW5_007401 [Stephanodiscus triporus]|uniref:RING-CH-type domain-containing protein n=1 Tax=Stephanodiscus triporus TaxID=2934178 RepID=A0ABD3QEW6_9STRA